MQTDSTKVPVQREPRSSDFAASRISKTAGIEEWLNALDGVAYVVAPDGTIIGVGRDGWNGLAQQGGAINLSSDQVVGRCLFDMIADDEAKALMMALHRRVATLARNVISYEYRCDSPTLALRMRMSISALLAEGRLLGVLYQSTLLSAIDRVPLEFLDNSEETRERARNAKHPFVKICQFCANVSMVGWGNRWIRPAEYYRSGGPAEVQLSHGVCPDCEHTRLEPLLRS